MRYKPSHDAVTGSTAVGESRRKVKAMRRFIQVSFVLFTAGVFALSAEAQRRGRGRGRTQQAAAVQTEPPMTDRIAQEMGSIQWGWSHDQVIDYYRRALVAQYLPLLKNKGQVEQDRLMQERDAIVANLRRSYLLLNGTVAQRRWDTSFVGAEYTHNNGESMLVYENPRTGDREFFFFFNDRLWKRFQARNVPRGAQLDFNTFIGSLDGLFGAPGLRRTREGQPDRIEAVFWQDATTRLRVIDHSTFYGAFCLVYEDKSVLARLNDLRRNMPAKTDNTTPTTLPTETVVGNVEVDQNSDVVDRITGKIRRVQSADAGATASSGATTTTRPSTPSSTSSPSSSSGSAAPGDPLGNLRGL
jgi:hypothetical protein